MNGKEFLKALNNIVKEKHIDKEVVLEAMEAALNSAYKKNFEQKTNSKVRIDRKTGDIKVYSYIEVIDEAKKEDEDYNPEWMLTKEELIARYGSKYDDYEVGDTLDTEITPEDFGRVATSTAKQVLVQKIREAERESLASEFESLQDELAVGTVEMEDENNYFINLGRQNGILPKKECIPGETIVMGKQLKVYVSKVDNSGKGLLILLSRTHYGFVKRLFESEIPELSDGSVVIYSVARDPGNRSKVAVYSTRGHIDPIGACIGERGTRIARIINELGGEKVDLVRYSENAEDFIESALSPAKDLHVLITDDEKNEALVVADGDNFSLAIGKAGINVRLASRLTHYKLDIKSSADASEMGINFAN